MEGWVIVAVIAGSGVGAVVVVVGTMALVGRRLPVAHSATVRAVIPAAPEAVWEALTDWRRMPEWRPELKRVEPLEDAAGRAGWVERSRHGRLPMVIETAEPPHLLVGRIVGDRLPFGGTWTYRLAPAAEGATEIAITEDGEVYNPLFRFMARFVFGHHATMAAYLKSLGRRFGAEVAPERAPGVLNAGG